MFVLFVVLSAIASLVCSQSSTVMTSTSTSATRVNTWEDLYVMPVSVIFELSRVCIVMSRRDYTLAPSSSYKYINYPSSYRATLTQATDVIDRAFRTAEMSMSRVQMIMGQVPNQLNTALRLLFEASIEERRIFLPDTLNDIVRRANDVTSIVGEVSTALEQATAFFDELLRAVQPTPPPSTTVSPSASTSTQANKSPLDIDHATAISNTLANFKSLTVAWNQMAQQSNKLALLASRSVQFINERNTLIRMLGDIDQASNLLSTLASFYSSVSMKLITSRTVSMASFLMLESEEERLSKVQQLNEQANHNIPLLRQKFAQALIDHETHNKERNEQYESLIATPST